MHILVINCGSSSLKSSILEHATGEHVAMLSVERIGEAEPRMRLDSGDWESIDAENHTDALRHGLDRLLESVDAEIAAVGHRVVHGGNEFDRAVVIDDEVIDAIEACVPLAPLHNPGNLAGIRAATEVLADVTHVACFDTAFHSTLPSRARAYALPAELAEKHQIRRYGFHGTSHQFVAQQAADYMETDLRDLRIITCHLGNGCSMAAVEYGRSVETSMGMTPLEGLVMGTRSGDLDPGVVLELMRREDLSVDEMDDLLNRSSGLAGLSGVGNDMRDILSRAAEGDERCRKAIQVFTHRVRKYVGAYAAVMGGVDAIVFTAGIGENSEMIRHRIAQRLEFLGARLDEDANRDASVSHNDRVAEISSRNSRVRLLTVCTDEALQIARETAALSLDAQKTRSEKKIPIAISARHVHLTQETVEKLFGEGYKLTERNPLSQPGQFACNETVTVVGPRRNLEGVRILGPTRSVNQVEISRTDEFFVGIDAPVRASGDVANSPGCTLIGPEGSVELEQGVICAWRHIHMTPEDAVEFGVKDKDVVDVRVNTDGRSLVFGDVLVRVKDTYKLEMHIDTDEGNAAELTNDVEGALAGTDCDASLNRRRTRYDSV